MRKEKELLGFFFFSLRGNGSFLSIKDAVTCLQHHVGYNLGRTRNFCQLIFPCPGARRCALTASSPFRCPEHCTSSSQLSHELRAGSRALGLAGITRICPHIALSCCCSLSPRGGISKGDLCCSVLAAAPVARNWSVSRLFS